MAEGYARPELLAEPDWLAAHAQDPQVRVIDCGTLEQYHRAHIAGAVGLPVHHYIKDRPGGLFVMPAEQFAELMGTLGVDATTTVIVYDDDNSRVATRLWWVLTYYGHTQTKVLNGGWHRWVTEGRPVTFTPATPPPATFHVSADENMICRLDDLKANLGRPGFSVLDVRSDEEWLGPNARGTKRRGHVPGAVHLEWINFISKDDRRVFLPADELRAMFASAGLPPEAEVVTY